MNAATTSSDQSEMPAASRQRSASRRSMSSSRRSMRDGSWDMCSSLEMASDGLPNSSGDASCASESRRRWPVASTSALPGSRRGSLPRTRSRCCSPTSMSACEIDFAGRFWMDYDWAAGLGELAPRARHRSLDARAAGRVHGARRARQEAEHGDRDARPLGGDRAGRRRGAGRDPPRVPARPHAGGGDRLGLRAARRAPDAARGKGSSGRLRDRGDGARSGSRLARRHRRDRVRGSRGFGR